MNALVVLVVEGALSHQDVMEALRVVLEDPHTPNSILLESLESAELLHPGPLLPAIRAGFQSGRFRDLAPAHVMTAEDYETAAARAVDETLAELRPIPAFRFITDAAHDYRHVRVRNVEDLLTELDDPDAPLNGIHETLAEWELARPQLLTALRAVEDPVQRAALDESHRLHMVAMYLCAERREKEAFPLLLKWMRLPDDERGQLLGDLEAEDGGSLLASCFDGNLQGLVEVARDPVAGWGAVAAVNALVVLGVQGGAPRDRIIDALREIIAGTPRSARLPVWSAVAYAVTQLHPGELRREIDAVVLDLVAHYDTSPEEVAEAAAMSVEECLARARADPHHDYIRSAAASLQWMAPSSDPHAWTANPRALEDDRDGAPASLQEDEEEEIGALPWSPHRAEPFVREQPKLGRNDPCHCGSGKKYQKCHLEQDQRS